MPKINDEGAEGGIGDDQVVPDPEFKVAGGNRRFACCRHGDQG